MKLRPLLFPFVSGLLFAACASDNHSSGNAGNLDLPTAANTPTHTTTGTATSAVNHSVSTMDDTVATSDAVVTSTVNNTATAVNNTATAATNTASAAVPSVPGATAPYTVVQGDSLWKIARNHKTSVNTLKALNNMTSDVIRPGQTLLVPAK